MNIGGFSRIILGPSWKSEGPQTTGFGPLAPRITQGRVAVRLPGQKGISYRHSGRREGHSRFYFWLVSLPPTLTRDLLAVLCFMGFSWQPQSGCAAPFYSILARENQENGVASHFESSQRVFRACRGLKMLSFPWAFGPKRARSLRARSLSTRRARGFLPSLPPFLPRCRRPRPLLRPRAAPAGVPAAGSFRGLGVLRNFRTPGFSREGSRV